MAEAFFWTKSGISLTLQAKLLRVLQDGEFERIGSSKSIHVNVRTLAATHRNPEALVKAGAMRISITGSMSSRSSCQL